MHEYMIKLNSMEDIKEFNCAVSKYEGNVDLTSQRYVVDAKSIMGIISLDLSNPVKMLVYGDQPEMLVQKVEKYIIE